MTKEKKSLSKSIRMTERVYSIVNECDGKGFNEKFENLVLQIRIDREELTRDMEYWQHNRSKYVEELDTVHILSRAMDESAKCIADIQDSLSAIQKWIASLPPEIETGSASKDGTIHSSA